MGSPKNPIRQQHSYKTTGRKGETNGGNPHNGKSVITYPADNNNTLLQPLGL